MILYVCIDIDSCNSNFCLYWYVLLKIVSETEICQGWKMKKERKNIYQSHWKEMITFYNNRLTWQEALICLFHEDLYEPVLYVYYKHFFTYIQQAYVTEWQQEFTKTVSTNLFEQQTSGRLVSVWPRPHRKFQPNYAIYKSRYLRRSNTANK
jgi:hypothetical protein